MQPHAYAEELEELVGVASVEVGVESGEVVAGDVDAGAYFEAPGEVLAAEAGKRRVGEDGADAPLPFMRGGGVVNPKSWTLLMVTLPFNKGRRSNFADKRATFSISWFFRSDRKSVV